MSMITVIRAKKDIRSQSIISFDLLEEVLLPETAYQKDSITKPDQALGKVATHLIFQGQAIKTSDLCDESATR